MILPHAPTRRAMLAGSGALFASAHMPRLAHAEGRDPRFLTIVLRGALDGLATVAPVGDPDWIALRGDNALRFDGKVTPLKLDDFSSCAQYRERSHFDGQDLLESGLPQPAPSDSGWLNRALHGLASAGRVDAGERARALGVGPALPLVVRGPAPVLTWSPQNAPAASEDTARRLVDLYRHADVKLANVMEENTRLAAMEHGDDMRKAPANQPRAYFADAAGTAARFLAQPNGPRIGALALDGWDTHNNEGIAGGRLAQLLGSLDGALAAIKSNMGPAWRETVVALVTEFGRTARINGTEGTDHGTATVALLAGGALKGGRVIADWPGLKPADLYENRDLKPTTDLRAVLKGVLKDHLRADDRTLAETVFPGSKNVRPPAGLVG